MPDASVSDLLRALRQYDPDLSMVPALGCSRTGHHANGCRATVSPERNILPPSRAIVRRLRRFFP
ncbi:MAG TPA: hypothetical protein VIV60_12720 [Polyangiaceae bacterium]